MACSLELRAPFLDHEVLELGLALPDSLKVRGTRGKVALRRAFAADLPPRDPRRGKRGFGVPVARWFRTELRELAGDLLLGERASARGLFRPRRRRAPARRARRRAGRPRRAALEPRHARAWQREYADSARDAVAAARRRSVSSPQRATSWLVAAACVAPAARRPPLRARRVLSEYTEKSDDFARTFVDSGTYGFIPGEPSA